VQKDVTVSKTDACTQTVDLTMTLTPRASLDARQPRRADAPPDLAAVRVRPAPTAAAGANGFEALAVNQNTATAGLDLSLLEGNQQDLTPAGFGSEAVADAFAVTGDAARVDRGALNERQNNFIRGEFQIPDARAAGYRRRLRGRTADAGRLNGGNPGLSKTRAATAVAAATTTILPARRPRRPSEAGMQVNASYGFSGPR
jgi:hypothetical protein